MECICEHCDKEFDSEYEGGVCETCGCWICGDCNPFNKECE